MKLRLRADTLRLRLTRGEVEQIGQGQPVSEATHFPDGNVLSYALVPGERNGARLETSDTGQFVRIELDGHRARTWAGSDEVGFSGDTPFTVGALEVLIEKDFTCITPRDGEEELDTYPNPNVSHTAG